MLALAWGWLTSKIAGPIAAGVAVLFALAFAWQTAQIDGWPIFGGGYKAQVAALKLRLADAAAAQASFAARANAAVLAAQTAQRAAQDKIAAAYRDGLAHAQIVTQTIIRKVPVYVSAKSDAACVVPWGAIRLFDAAASGSDPGAVAALIAPGQPDDAASGIALSDFVALLAQNFGAARDNADQLTALQAAMRAPTTDH
jgi:hypothetical protein